MKLIHNKKSDWLNFLAGNTCIACGLPLQQSFVQKASKTKLGNLAFSQKKDEAESLTRRLGLCSACLTDLPLLRPLVWHGMTDLPFPVMTVFSYEKPIDRLLLQLKFYQKAYLADYLAELVFLLTQKIWQEISGNIILCPIPLSVKRFKERGYNQSDLIAAKIARLANIYYLPDLLLRVKNTKRQSETKHREERRINLRNAFCLNQDILQSKGEDFLQDKEIILFDDIVTSGMTLLSAAESLLEKNCRIRAFTVATERDFS